MGDVPDHLRHFLPERPEPTPGDWRDDAATALALIGVFAAAALFVWWRA